MALKIATPDCPRCGEPAEGTVDDVPGIAIFGDIDEEGRTEWGGETRMCWDGQMPRTNDAGEVLVQCPNWHEWYTSLDRLHRDATPSTGRKGQEGELMKVVLKPGDTLEVGLEDTDGRFEIKYDVPLGHLTVSSDLPDEAGREGVIYDEIFVSTQEDEGRDAPMETRYKTTYVVEVLSREPIPDDMGLDAVLEESTNGSYSADVKSQVTQIVTVEAMRGLLSAQRSAPSFFDDDAESEVYGLDDVAFCYKGRSITWLWLGEGFDGDFTPETGDDERLLRVDVLLDGQEEPFSYCTLAPTSTPFAKLQRMSDELIRLLDEDPESPKHVIELWTHLTRPAVTPATATPEEAKEVQDALREMWDTNNQLQGDGATRNKTIEDNINKLCARFKFDLPLFHAWCRKFSSYEQEGAS